MVVNDWEMGQTVMRGSNGGRRLSNFFWYKETMCMESILEGGDELCWYGAYERIIKVHVMCGVWYVQRSRACLVR